MRLELPSVTLCAATSVNIDATMAAIDASTDQIAFGDVILFTDAPAADINGCNRAVRIPRLGSARDYSRFVLEDLVDHVRTDHLLMIQWDGFVLDAGQWDPQFLECDFIGAPWPQFADGHDVGNGGFSLRSRKLLQACRSPGFVQSHPEDVAIGRRNRDYLEREHGIVFAECSLAARFSAERSLSPTPTFGFHGVFNMIPLLGADRFWSVYNRLSDRGTVYRDVALIMRQLGTAPKAGTRRLRLMADMLKASVAQAFQG